MNPILEKAYYVPAKEKDERGFGSGVLLEYENGPELGKSFFDLGERGLMIGSANAFAAYRGKFAVMQNFLLEVQECGEKRWGTMSVQSSVDCCVVFTYYCEEDTRLGRDSEFSRRVLIQADGTVNWQRENDLLEDRVRACQSRLGGPPLEFRHIQYWRKEMWAFLHLHGLKLPGTPALDGTSRLEKVWARLPRGRPSLSPVVDAGQLMCLDEDLAFWSWLSVGLLARGFFSRAGVF